MIEIECDNCKNSINEGDSVFCWTCYKKEAEKLEMKKNAESKDSYIRYIDDELHNLCSFLVNEHLDIYEKYKKLKEVKK